MSYDLIDGAELAAPFFVSKGMAMTKRHSDALAISAGAVNPSGMAHALVSACRECIQENVNQRDDAAVRLIVSQIAYMCGVWDGVADFARQPDFHQCTRECEKKEATVSEPVASGPRFVLLPREA